MILGFSLQSVKQSITISGQVTDIVLEQDESYQQLKGDRRQIKNDKTHDFLRSSAHVCMFAGLAFCAGMLVRTYSKKWIVPIALPSCMLFAVMDEAVQHFRNAGRSFQLEDIYRDWLGAVIGIAVAVLAALVLFWVKRKKQGEFGDGVSGRSAG